MAVAPRQTAPIRIETPRAEHAAALVRSLAAVFDGAELALDGDWFEVHVLPRGDWDAAVVRVLETVEEWLLAERLDSTRIHLDGRSYRIPAPVASGRRR